MTKLFEALDYAGKIRHESPEKVVSEPVVYAPMDEADECMLLLHQRIEPMVDGARRPVLMFVGVPSGKDSSRFTSRFARVVSRSLGKAVLLLKTDARPEPFGTGIRSHWSRGDSVQPAAEPARTVRRPCLVTHKLNKGDLAIQLATNSEQAERLIEDWRGAYDLVVIDAPSVDRSPSSGLLCSSADGVVLIVEAGRTRWQAVKRQVEEIVEQHGRVLGVVMNRQRRYIPDWIYRHL